ncbi:MAG: helix-turn-helix domain-containing protein [Actinomycetota bacterium]
MSGIGAALRAERERRHISLDAVARGTLVRLDFLELIDEDRIEDLPAGAYAKGFIRAYATHLGLDWRPFAKAYEAQYAQPAPELSRVVRRGVRVPPAAQRRAWKLATTGAGSLILLLALLGAFRGGEDPADVPVVQASAVRAPQTQHPNPMGAIVRVEVTGQASWVEAKGDGQTLFAGTLYAGESRTFRGTDRVVLFLARAREVSITANGKILGAPTEPSFAGVFTPGTEELPAHEPGAFADATAAPSASASAPPTVPTGEASPDVSPSAQP